MLPTKFRNNWPFSSGEEAKNRFSRWQPCPASWISDQSNFSYFWPTSHPAASYQVSSQLAFRFRRRSKKRFSSWPPWGPSWISDQHDFSCFDLQVIPMLPTKFEVNWLFGSGEEAKNTFWRWPPWWPSLNSNRNVFSYFLSKSHPDASYQVLSQLAQGCRSRLLKQLLTPHNGGRTLTDHNSSPMSTSCSGELIMVMIMKILTPTNESHKC